MAKVVVPCLEGDVLIRQFQPQDAAQIHALLVEGLVYGPESPCNATLYAYLFRPISCVAYGLFILGLMLFRQDVYSLKVAACFISLGALALFSSVRYSIIRGYLNVCASAKRTDMADISTTYRVPLAVQDLDSTSVQGPGGFWVAVIESVDKSTSKVVGYLGSDYHADDNPTSSELRRMIVSMHHRRRGIGTLLIHAVLAHSKNHRIPLLTLDLETSEFQPGARALYEQNGWEYIGQRPFYMGPFVSVGLLRFRRKVERGSADFVGKDLA
ncbi:acyl-CoA N-acyltransferase [Mycena rebaudengoi]|nr:acyl-CoA N-acyltransferase [Mycena rebaudengoi]